MAAKTGNQAVAMTVPAAKKKKRSQRAELWRRFKKSKTALIGFGLLALVLVTAIFANQIAPHSYDGMNLMVRRQPPSAEYLMGTDHMGRCVFSRVVYGTRISLVVGFFAVLLSAIAGGTIGAISGFYGDKVDNFIMRIIDVVLSIPPILLAIAIVSAFGGSLVNVMIAIAIGYTPRFARVVRGSVMTIKEDEFIDAARVLGASDYRIITKHIMPNALAPVIVQGTLFVAMAILQAAGLSFIGLGAQPPTPEWGAMLSTGQNYIRDAWWMSVFPGLAIAVTVLSLNLLGDGLRDALDPRLKT